MLYVVWVLILLIKFVVCEMVFDGTRASYMSPLVGCLITFSSTIVFSLCYLMCYDVLLEEKKSLQPWHYQKVLKDHVRNIFVSIFVFPPWCTALRTMRIVGMVSPIQSTIMLVYMNCLINKTNIRKMFHNIGVGFWKVKFRQSHTQQLRILIKCSTGHHGVYMFRYEGPS